MKRFAAGLVASIVCSVPLVAQEQDRSLERIRLALQQPFPVERGVDPVETARPRTFGILTLVPPVLPGEVIRVSVPIGELVSRAIRNTAAANRRRQAATARRQVEADLERFKQQQPRPQQ